MRVIWLYIVEMYKMLYKIKGIWVVLFQTIQTPSLVRYQAALRTDKACISTTYLLFAEVPV